MRAAAVSIMTIMTIMSIISMLIIFTCAANVSIMSVMHNNRISLYRLCGGNEPCTYEYSVQKVKLQH